MGNPKKNTKNLRPARRAAHDASRAAATTVGRCFVTRVLQPARPAAAVAPQPRARHDAAAFPCTRHRTGSIHRDDRTLHMRPNRSCARVPSRAYAPPDVGGVVRARLLRANHRDRSVAYRHGRLRRLFLTEQRWQSGESILALRPIRCARFDNTDTRPRCRDSADRPGGFSSYYILGVMPIRSAAALIEQSAGFFDPRPARDRPRGSVENGI